MGADIEVAKASLKRIQKSVEKQVEIRKEIHRKRKPPINTFKPFNEMTPEERKHHPQKQHVETYEENAKKVREAIITSFIEKGRVPTISEVSRTTGMMQVTAAKHMRNIDPKLIREMGASKNLQIMQRHFEALTSEEKLNPALLAQWYDQFGMTEKKENEAKASGDSGKIVINIVAAEPKRVQVEEAEIIP